MVCERDTCSVCMCVPAVVGKPRHVMPVFRYQYQVLTRNHIVTEANRNLLVETFRCIAEILIWGDQNDSRVFE